MSEVVKTRLRKQVDIFERVKKAQENYKKSPKDRFTATYIETRTEALERLWGTFVDGHYEIAGSLDTGDKSKLAYFEEDMYTECEEVYIDYKTRLKDDLKKYMPLSNSSSIAGAVAPGISGTCSEVKLPQIHLPKFSSGYEEWQTFHHMFNSLINKNTSLSTVQKLHYLKSCLAGEAESLLKNLSTTEVNYSEAWQLLIHRYSNKRFNTNEIMKRLFAQRNLTSESPTALRQLLDTTTSCLKSLENLQIDTSSWDAIINYLIVSKLDTESRKLWEVEVSRVYSDDNADKLPTWTQLKKFLEMRFRTLEMIEPIQTYNSKSTTKTSQYSNTRQPIKQRAFHSSVLKVNKSYTCTMCSGQHTLYQCKQFATQSPEKRSEFVQCKGLCFNCLSATHAVKNCQVSTCCRRCGKRHHTLLHYERVFNQDSATVESSSSERASTEAPQSSKQRETRVVAHFTKEIQQSRVLLPTAMVKIKSPTGYSQIARVLIDQGSEATFISEATAQSLKVKRSAVNGVVSGVGDGQTRTKSMVSFEVESLHNSTFSIPVNAFVLKKLTSLLPSRDTSIPNWPELRTLPLADPTYGAPGRIDLILGAEVYGEILLEGLLKRSALSGPVAQNTQLGWILSGKMENRESMEDHKIISMHIQLGEDELLQQFSEIEGEPDNIRKRMTKEETRCEEICEVTTHRDKEGRYVVRLPFKGPDPECLKGESKEIVLRRFKSQEKRLLRDTKLHEEYKTVIKDYLHQNHTVIIRDNNIPPAKRLLGRITEKHSGRDNITRVVSLKTKNGIFKRPCNKLCFLPKTTE